MIALSLVIQLVAGDVSNEIEVHQLGFQDLTVCQMAAARMNERTFTPKINDKGKMVIHQRQDCLVVFDFQIDKAAEMLAGQ